MIIDEDLMVRIISMKKKNTCNKVVGGAADAKAQVYYTCQYCTKNPVNLQESLPLLQTARALATKYH